MYWPKETEEFTRLTGMRNGTVEKFPPARLTYYYDYNNNRLGLKYPNETAFRFIWTDVQPVFDVNGIYVGDGRTMSLEMYEPGDKDRNGRVLK